VAKLEKQNEQLTGRLNRLSDVAYMEKLARERLGVVRPGETSYVIVPAPAPLRPAAATEPEPKGLRQQAAEWVKELLGRK
jgi:hypothetical protein